MPKPIIDLNKIEEDLEKIGFHPVISLENALIEDATMLDDESEIDEEDLIPVVRIIVRPTKQNFINALKARKLGSKDVIVPTTYGIVLPANINDFDLENILKWMDCHPIHKATFHSNNPYQFLKFISHVSRQTFLEELDCVVSSKLSSEPDDSVNAAILLEEKQLTEKFSKQLQTFSHLRQLNLRDGDARGNNLALLFKAIGEMTELEVLTLNNYSLSQKHLPQLADLFATLPKLRKVDLGNNHFNDDCLPQLAASLQNCEALTDLNLSGNQLTGRNIEQVFNLNNLRDLDLSFCSIENEGAILIAAQMQKMPKKLYGLNLSNNIFGNVALNKFADLLPTANLNLRHLNLSTSSEFYDMIDEQQYRNGLYQNHELVEDQTALSFASALLKNQRLESLTIQDPKNPIHDHLQSIMVRLAFSKVVLARKELAQHNHIKSDLLLPGIELITLASKKRKVEDDNMPGTKPVPTSPHTSLNNNSFRTP